MRTIDLPVWKHSRIYHMTHASNWTSIQQYGLLSTSSLLSLAGLDGDERYYLERRQRLRALRLPNGALIRDQLPVSPDALERCLASGLVPEDWYAELNRRGILLAGSSTTEPTTSRVRLLATDRSDRQCPSLFVQVFGAIRADPI